MKQAVLLTGAFDLLHDGHRYLLKTAKALADACGGFVVCMVNSDAMIQASKGPTRPRQTAKIRIDNIRSQGILDSNDLVEEFYSDLELEFICQGNNPIRILGSDYVGKPIIGAKYCKHIFFIERTNDSTTSKILDQKAV